MRLAAQLQTALSALQLKLLTAAASHAAAHDAQAWLVGGPVRDLLLGRPVTDLDIVIEGPAPAVAAALASAVQGRLIVHAAFGTATVQHPSGLSLDLVTARRESYPHPAALPVVAPADLAADLARRDFTINTLALSLDAGSWAELRDPHAGQADLAAAVIRVLHPQSFQDDPTRILRAARFAARLGYTVEPGTTALIPAARPALAQTTPARLLHELRLLIREPQPAAALGWLGAWDVAAALDLTVTPQCAQWFSAAERLALAAPLADEVRLGLLAAGARRWAARYPITASERRMIAGVAQIQALAPALELPVADAELDRLLQPVASEAALLVAEITAPTPPVAAQLGRYRAALRPVKTLLSGDDLRRLGCAPGPRFRQLLAALRAAQLAGAVTTTADAERWVLAQPPD